VEEMAVFEKQLPMTVNIIVVYLPGQQYFLSKVKIKMAGTRVFRYTSNAGRGKRGNIFIPQNSPIKLKLAQKSPTAENST